MPILTTSKTKHNTVLRQYNNGQKEEVTFIVWLITQNKIIVATLPILDKHSYDRDICNTVMFRC